MDAELINKIVEQVLVALGQAAGAKDSSAAKPLAGPQKAAPGAASSAVAAPVRQTAAQAPVAAPAGASASRGAAPHRPSASTGALSQKKVFLTADMLRQRIVSLNGQAKVIELDGFEFLTPAAEDFAADAHVTIQRRPQPLVAKPLAAKPLAAAPQAGHPAPASAAIASASAFKSLGAAPDAALAAVGEAYRPAPPAKLPGYGLVTAKLTDAAATAVRTATQSGLKLEDWNRKGCWLRDSRTMCEAIVAGTLAGGIVLVPQAADAIVLTAKHRSIRPVQGTRPDSVRNALRHYDANVLVIEHAACTFHEMREMIRLFVSARPARESTTWTDALMRHVGEVEAS